MAHISKILADSIIFMSFLIKIIYAAKLILKLMKPFIWETGTINFGKKDSETFTKSGTVAIRESHGLLGRL